MNNIEILRSIYEYLLNNGYKVSFNNDTLLVNIISTNEVRNLVLGLNFNKQYKVEAIVAGPVSFEL